MDATLYDVVLSFLKDHPNICVSPPKTMNLRGIGAVVTYELSTKIDGFVSCQRIPFTVSEKGRLLISEKVAFMQNAKCEIIARAKTETFFSALFFPMTTLDACMRTCLYTPKDISQSLCNTSQIL